jgi:hypothetical protein
MALEMNATTIMKSVPQLIQPGSTIYHFEGELNGYNQDTKKEETVSHSGMDIYLYYIFSNHMIASIDISV